MTKVVCTTQNNKLTMIRIEGHAGYARKGFDIVCAAISSIVEGTQSFFKVRYLGRVVIDRNNSSVTFSVANCCGDKDLQVCLQMFIHQLKNVSFFYPGYITVVFAG